MRILMFLMLCTLWLPIAHAQESMLMGAESAPIIFQRESIRILPTAPEKPTEQTTEASPQNTIPNPRFPIVYSVEIRDERALGFDYIHALNQLNTTNGVLIFFSAPTVTPLPRFQIHKPVDVLFINEQGVILEILPNHIPGEQTQDILANEPVKAWLYIMAGQVAARDIRPHDTVQGNIFTAAPAIMR